MTKTIIWECPYCRHENCLLIDMFQGEEICYCASEEGGCDERVVIRWGLKCEMFELKEIDMQ